MVPQKLLTAEVVSERLSVCLSLVYRMARSGELPSVKFGRSVRFREEDVDRFILNNLRDDEMSVAENIKYNRQIGKG